MEVWDAFTHGSHGNELYCSVLVCKGCTTNTRPTKEEDGPQYQGGVTRDEKKFKNVIQGKPQEVHKEGWSVQVCHTLLQVQMERLWGCPLLSITLFFPGTPKCVPLPPLVIKFVLFFLFFLTSSMFMAGFLFYSRGFTFYLFETGLLAMPIPQPT